MGLPQLIDAARSRLGWATPRLNGFANEPAYVDRVAGDAGYAGDDFDRACKKQNMMPRKSLHDRLPVTIAN